MSEEIKKSKKSLIIGICCTVAVVIVAVVALALINKNSKLRLKTKNMPQLKLTWSITIPAAK